MTTRAKRTWADDKMPAIVGALVEQIASLECETAAVKRLFERLCSEFVDLRIMVTDLRNEVRDRMPEPPHKLVRPGITRAPRTSRKGARKP